MAQENKNTAKNVDRAAVIKAAAAAKATETKAKEEASKKELSFEQLKRQLGKLDFKELSTGKGKKVKVEFIASPTGILKLGYGVGEVASFEEKQAEYLVLLELAKYVK